MLPCNNYLVVDLYMLAGGLSLRQYDLRHWDALKVALLNHPCNNLCLIYGLGYPQVPSYISIFIFANKKTSVQ